MADTVTIPFAPSGESALLSRVLHLLLLFDGVDSFDERENFIDTVDSLIEVLYSEEEGICTLDMSRVSRGSVTVHFHPGAVGIEAPVDAWAQVQSNRDEYLGHDRLTRRNAAVITEGLALAMRRTARRVRMCRVESSGTNALCGTHGGLLKDCTARSDALALTEAANRVLR